MLRLLRRLSWVEKSIIISTIFYGLIFLAVLIVRPGTDTTYKTFQNFYQFLPPFLSGIAHWIYSARTLEPVLKESNE